MFDTYEDTVVTETCEEVVTTHCTEKSQTTTVTSAVVDTSSRLVHLGAPTPIPVSKEKIAHPHKVKRSPDAEPVYGATAPVSSVPTKTVSPPVCTSTPVKTCNRVPVSTPRKVARTVCNTVVDVTTIEVSWLLGE